MKEHCEYLAHFNLPEDVPQSYSVRRLTGDASTRSYFRISARDGSTVVLMKMPEPFEINNFNYLDNYHLFRSLRIPLAEIYLMKPSLGYIFLQDLGDDTFYEAYNRWNQQDRLHHYLTALDYLTQIERVVPVSQLSFDTEKFLWELRFFQKHFLIGLRKIDLSEEESEVLQNDFLKLAQQLSERPRVFCHRDYHSRNLMFQDSRIYVIDFQDARLGPCTYDLASLCYDSYIQHPKDFIDGLEETFFDTHKGVEIRDYEYPRMCLQRNLKALGTFGYQVSQLDRPFYLQFVGPTLAYVRQHLEKLPEYEGLKRILAFHLPERG